MMTSRPPIEGSPHAASYWSLPRRSSTTRRTLSMRLSLISFLPLNTWRGDLRAGRKVVQRRVALASHDKALVALGGDVVADGAVASHAPGVRHEHARLAGDIGAEI